MKNNSERFQLIRNTDLRCGNAEYKGIPCVEVELIDLIGWEGVKIIDQKIQQALKIKKQLHELEKQLYYAEISSDHNALPYVLKFADYQKHRLISASQGSVDFFLNNPNDDREFITENPNLVKDNYKLLRNLDHYVMIESYFAYPPTKEKFLEEIKIQQSILPSIEAIIEKNS